MVSRLVVIVHVLTVTYVCARHFVYHGRPMVDEHGTDSMGNMYVEARRGRLQTYSSLRAAAFVMGQMVYVPEQEFGF
uniref:Uncharacterized protein n=1 Tax=uncultured organism MedDCM-OCT-S04-C46 TaxID=743616 RepID=D6PJ44_9ZZZZ|nr:hypothetical protein [uncultured organism MedDCM-OCT-S04-C46]